MEAPLALCSAPLALCGALRARARLLGRGALCGACFEPEQTCAESRQRLAGLSRLPSGHTCGEGPDRATDRMLPASQLSRQAAPSARTGTGSQRGQAQQCQAAHLQFSKFQGLGNDFILVSPLKLPLATAPAAAADVLCLCVRSWTTGTRQSPQ